jgi:aminopeptidase
MASASTIAPPALAFATLPFTEKLDRFAHLAVHVGLNLQPGQDLLISATTEMLPLVRRITEHAYKAGSPLVTTLYSDDETILARFRHAPDASFDRANQWLADGIFNAFSTGTTRLSLTGGNPALLSQQDPARVSRANIAASIASKPALDLITRHTINWSILAAATPAWAALVFPGLPEAEAVNKLWDAIFTASRATGDDPVADWRAHSAHIHERVAFLNKKRFHSLRFFSDDQATDLTVGLADDHLWAGGGAKSGNGIFSNANVPTEECFTTPHKDRVHGRVRASKPLSNQGTLIQDIACTFEAGRITKATASTGEDVLNRLISTDAGARSLGEVALVPHSSPIAQSGILFWNTLFDENAASHIALGQSYATCLIGGEHMDEQALTAKGANSSLIHVDWMIGSEQMNVDGLAADGSAEPLMRAGEWA